MAKLYDVSISAIVDHFFCTTQGLIYVVLIVARLLSMRYLTANARLGITSQFEKSCDTLTERYFEILDLD